MRIISLASGLVLACSLVAAPAMASAVSGVAAPSATSKPATRSEPAKAASKSKSATRAKKARAKGARKSVGPKSRVALARKSRLPRIDIDDLADRSTEAHASLLPERIYDGLLPGEGERKFAVKVVSRALLRKRRFGQSDAAAGADADTLREVAVLKRLQHRNVVALHEVIDDPDGDD